jgi:hypothetical protein
LQLKIVRGCADLHAAAGDALPAFWKVADRTVSELLQTAADIGEELRLAGESDVGTQQQAPIGTCFAHHKAEHPPLSHTSLGDEPLPDPETDTSLLNVETDPGSNIRDAGSNREVRNNMAKEKTFDDPEQMKQSIREKLQVGFKPAYNVKDHYHAVGVIQSIARSPIFEHFTLGVITLNAFWMSVDLDANDSVHMADADPIFQVMDHFFCVFFTAELLVRLLAFRNKLRAFRDAWFVFDFVLVCMMVTESWVIPIISVLTNDKRTLPLGDAVVLRLFRLLRLTRMTRVMRMVPELMIMVKGLYAGIRSDTIDRKIDVNGKNV